MSHLQHQVQFQAPQNTNIFKRVQHGDMKMVQYQEHDKNLRELRLLLKEGQAQEDLFIPYKCLKRHCKKWAGFFQLMPNDRMRANGHKTKHGMFHLNIRKQPFNCKDGQTLKCFPQRGNYIFQKPYKYAPGQPVLSALLEHKGWKRWPSVLCSYLFQFVTLCIFNTYTV